MTLQKQFGQIDIYLFDQILRGNISPGMRVVDAGCGGGRNLVYLLREGYEVFGVDADPAAVASVREMAQGLAPGLPSANFRVAGIEVMPFPDAFADVVVCHSVLHFAQDEANFDAMVRGLWRVLRPGGMLFCRLGTFIGAGSGIEFEPVGPRRFRMSHGAEWFLADEAKLMELTRALGGELVDPLKMTVVQAQRCMTTWVVKKELPRGLKPVPLVSSGMPGLR
jgi:SAM-dependent methyltransferase